MSHKMSKEQVRELYRCWAAQARDQARRLLRCGDPVKVEAVVRDAFLLLAEEARGERATEEKMPALLADIVVAPCIERGCVEGAVEPRDLVPANDGRTDGHDRVA